MTKSTLPKVLCVLVGCIAFGFSPQTASGQRGGGFHGGGFHGGGGHYGGHFYAGGHGGVHYSGHGGYGWAGGHGWSGGYHWHGGYWGYPHYHYGWGWGFGFWWPYWGLGYPYGYGGWYYAPYPNYPPQKCPPGYSCAPNKNDDHPPVDSSPKPQQNGTPEHTPNTNGETDDDSHTPPPTFEASYRRVVTNNHPIVQPAMQRNATLRPEMQKAMQALREMPPFAREREIETGRYSHFSPEEQEVLRNVN